MLTQWFDIASLDDPPYRSYTSLQGLEESFQEIMDLVKAESVKIALKNIVIGGLSRGCAMALICLLALEFPSGAFGMSGWLPFRYEMEEPLKPMEVDDYDPFGVEIKAHSKEVRNPATGILSYVRNLLSISNNDLPSLNKSALPTSIFLGHGTADEKVRLNLGEEACRAMRSMGLTVSWRDYHEQGHWYKIPDEVDDIVTFLEEHL